jgi:hypothetical protein
MIKVSDAESYLKHKIGDKTNNVVEVWEIFKSFCREPVEGEDEFALLFQCGIYDFTGEELFYFDFVRQFTVYEDEEYSRTEQLHCEFVFKPTDELKKLETSEWYFDTDGDMENFFAHVENLKEFQIPLKSIPLQLNIYQEVI